MPGDPCERAPRCPRNGRIPQRGGEVFNQVRVTPPVGPPRSQDGAAEVGGSAIACSVLSLAKARHALSPRRSGRNVARVTETELSRNATVGRTLSDLQRRREAVRGGPHERARFGSSKTRLQREKAALGWGPERGSRAAVRKARFSAPAVAAPERTAFRLIAPQNSAENVSQIDLRLHVAR